MLDLETFISMQHLTLPLVDLIEAMTAAARCEHLARNRATQTSFKEFTMQTRQNYMKISPAAMQALLGLETYLAKSSIEHPLLHLVKMRASQVNGCAYCLDMHSKDARAEGETEQRLYTLDAWRETPFFSPRERAALAWTEALTLVAQTHAPDDVYAQARAEFSEQELADLTLAIVAINGWNRISIGFRTEVGAYQPRKRPSPTAVVAG
jgi:AhpD family alkylhydroperoxidase